MAFLPYSRVTPWHADSMYPASFVRLVASGPLYGGPERWSVGFSLTAATENINSDSAREGTKEVLATAFRDFFATNNGVISQAAALDLVKVNVIGTNGKYLHSKSYFKEFSPVVTPGGGTARYPNQVALVATLETGFKRGLAARGRVFLPVPPIAVGPGGLITTSDQAAAVASCKVLLDGLNAAIPGSVVVVASDAGSGAIRPVRSVGVGRVLDTMRSRRTSLKEERTSTALTEPSGGFGSGIGVGGDF